MGKRIVVAALVAFLLAVTAAQAAQGAKLSGVKQFGIKEGIHRARFVSSDYICATQAEKGAFVYAGVATGKITYLHSELGESRAFFPTLVSGLRGAALMLDEYSDHVYVFGPDGNAIASCGLEDKVLATQYGSPVDILAAGNAFKEGFWLITERGYMLRVDSKGKLTSSFQLRRIFNAPEAYFSRMGRHGQSLYAFSPTASVLYEFSTTGGAMKKHELLPALSGDLPVTDAVLTDSNNILLTRGRRIFLISNGQAAEISAGGINDDVPLFLDTLGSRVLIYNHTGEMLVGDLK